MKNILLYCPINRRAVVFETIAAEVNRAGYNLIVLTTCERGAFHDQLDLLGVKNYCRIITGNSLVVYQKHAFYLRSFCKKHKIDTVWSHLQGCNFIAVLAQAFMKAKVVTFRHHFHAIIKEEGFKNVNRNEIRMGKIISRLAKEIVVPSSEVYEGMIQYEKVPAAKISIIPYIYDFKMYPQPDESVVTRLKNTYAAGMLIIVASRMIAMKRHELVLPVFGKLIGEGFDIKVLLMDEGEEKPELENYVESNKLQDRIFFPGYKTNIVDYMAAADLLVHPSYTEASSSLVKEFALNKKPVIVCSGVGDFDEYIVHGENGFLVQPGNEAQQFENYIREIYHQPELARHLGNKLKEKVVEVFSARPETVNRYLAKA